MDSADSRATAAWATWDCCARAFAWATVVALPLVLSWPWLVERGTYAFRDWDVAEVHRQLVAQSLLHDHQLPGWNPYLCGGFPAWGYIEADTTVVSPWLPFYLLATLPHALRVEVLGMTLLGALGSYLAAGRLTRSPGARALVVVLFAVNGRWGLQTAVGHTWHLAYALMPWGFWLYERAREPPLRVWRVALLALLMAEMIYLGAIYPLPHLLLFLGLWALGLALLERRAQPLVLLAVAGLVGLLLALPKLLPMAATFLHAPRAIESTEVLPLGALLTLLTAPRQGLLSRPAPLHPYAWHEWGMYIGTPGLLLLIAAQLWTRGPKERLLQAIGLFFVVLGCGAFHALAPWSLLHRLPLFSSQHVPSRFLYPAALILALPAAAGLGRLAERGAARFAATELLLALAVLAVGVDVARVAQQPLHDEMRARLPDPMPPVQPFSFVDRPTLRYQPPVHRPPSQLVTVLTNTGIVHCYGLPPFADVGALAADDPRYRGPLFIDGDGDGGGAATLTRWTPNRVEATVAGARDGATLVYNMNFDCGWSATLRRPDGDRRLDVFRDHDWVACRLPAGDGLVVFSYSPPGLVVGLAGCLLALAAIAGAAWRERPPRRRR